MSYSHEKIRKQIADYKVGMYKNENKTKLINCQALEKVCMGKLIFLWKQNLILSRVFFLEFGSTVQPFARKMPFP